MSKARPTTTLNQRDLFHFALNPAPVTEASPPVQVIETIRVAGKVPGTKSLKIEEAIDGVASGKYKPATLATEAVPVAVRACVDSRVLETALKCFKVIDTEATLEFTPAALRIAAVNGEHTILCRATLPHTGFVVYDTGDTTTEFHADIKALVKSLARAGKGKGRDVNLRVGKEGGAMSIGFRVAKGVTHTIAFKKPAHVPSSTSELHDYNITSLTCKAVASKTELIERLKDADLAAFLARIAISDRVICLNATDEQSEFDATIPVSESTGTPDGVACGIFETKALASAAKTLGAFKMDTNTVRAGVNAPLILRAEINQMTLEFKIATRIEKEDDETGEDEPCVDQAEAPADDHEYHREDAALPDDRPADEAAAPTDEENRP